MFRLDLPSFATPRRSFSSGRGVVLGVVGASAVAVLGGCAATPAPPLITRTDSSTKGGSGGSLNAALSKIDASTVQAWFNRWTTPPGATSSQHAPAVRIDTEVLARRHPAWRLADGLERGAISPSAPQIGAVLAFSAAPSFLTPPAALRPTLPRRPAALLRENFSDREVQFRQNAALDQFFASTAARDTLRGRDEAFLAQRALRDRIAATRRSAVSELDLSLIPPEVALELTNLHLQLLRNLAKTPAQRAAAREQIAAIQARYAQIWREQTALQAAKIRQMTLDLPAQQEREGLAAIARETQTDAKNRIAARRAVAGALKDRLAADFSRSDDDLSLFLPAVPQVPSVPGAPQAPNAQFFETAHAFPSSVAATDARPLAHSRRFDAALIARLRAQARSDAIEWARLVAARWGKRWDNRAGGPNRTGAAVQALFRNTVREN